MTLLLLAVVAAALARDAWLLFRHPVAVGVDGYYYALQVESLHEQGALFFRSGTPLVLYLLAALKLCVDDTVSAIKLGSLVFHAALAAGVYGLLKTLTGSVLHGACGALIIATSGVHLFMLSEYVANAGGLALLVWGAYFTARAARTGATLWKAGAVICLTGACLSHRSCAFLVAALALASVIHYLLTAAGVGRRVKLTAGAVGMALFISPPVLAAQTLVALPAVMANDMLTSLRLPFGRVAVLEKCLLLVCSLLFLCLSLKSPRRGRSLVYKALGAVALLSLLLTLNPLLDRSAGWLSASERVGALAYVQLAVLLPGLLWLLSPLAGRLAGPLCAASAICFVALSFALPLPHGLRDDYLLDRAALIKSLTEKRPALTGLRKVIASHGEQFVVTHALGVPAQQRVAPGEDTSKAHWLLQHSDGVNAHSVEGVIVLNERRSTSLVPDRRLDALLRAMPLKEGLELTKANPHLIERVLSATGAHRLRAE